MTARNSPEPASAPFRDPNVEPEARIQDLLGRLTLEEKIDCLSTNPSVPRLGVFASRHIEGLHGVALGGPGNWGKEHPFTTTTFPQAIGLAATWNPELVRRAAEVEAIEARYVFHKSERQHGGIVVRAPNADLGRDPRWGRTEECFGEDAFLTSVLSVAFVRGLQGDHPKYWRAASLLKHFLANSNENGRERSSSDFDAELLHDYYARPFREAIVQGGARAFMAAYNRYNGIPCAVHPILKGITVEQWNNDGIICTDGGAFKMLVTEHAYYADLEQAAAGTLRAGITQYLDDYRASVRAALEHGLIREADIESAVVPNFRVMLRLGLLDPPGLCPYESFDAEREPWNEPASRELCREVTRQSIVLLKNSEALLPLAPRELRSIALIGPLADQVLLDWYSGTPPYTVSALEGVRARLGPNVDVLHSDGSSLEVAASIARKADVALVCVGNHPTGDGPWAKVTRPSYGKEAVDRETLELEDETLVKSVLAANPKSVLVLLSSFPYAIAWSQAHVPAIVHLTHNSQELGNALADVLFGDYNPAGRLVQTWPRSNADLLPMMDYDIRHGRTYQYSRAQPLYAFGFGLSYTHFAYSSLDTSAATLRDGEALRVSVNVTNVGARAGDEVVELYVLREPSSKRPRKELVGFARVGLAVGETRAVSFELSAAKLARFDAESGDFRLETAEVELAVGGSSDALALKKALRVCGPRGAER